MYVNIRCRLYSVLPLGFLFLVVRNDRTIDHLTGKTTAGGGKFHVKVAGKRDPSSCEYLANPWTAQQWTVSHTNNEFFFFCPPRKTGK